MGGSGADKHGVYTHDIMANCLLTFFFFLFKKNNAEYRKFFFQAWSNNKLQLKIMVGLLLLATKHTTSRHSHAGLQQLICCGVSEVLSQSKTVLAYLFIYLF